MVLVKEKGWEIDFIGETHWYEIHRFTKKPFLGLKLYNRVPLYTKIQGCSYCVFVDGGDRYLGYQEKIRNYVLKFYAHIPHFDDIASRGVYFGFSEIELAFDFINELKVYYEANF